MWVALALGSEIEFFFLKEKGTCINNENHGNDSGMDTSGKSSDQIGSHSSLRPDLAREWAATLAFLETCLVISLRNRVCKKQ